MAHPIVLVSHCGSSSVVEYNLAKVGVAGSNPVFRSKYGALAQLGERLLCTQEVSGSIPLGSTITLHRPISVLNP